MRAFNFSDSFEEDGHKNNTSVKTNDNETLTTTNKRLFGVIFAIEYSNHAVIMQRKH